MAVTRRATLAAALASPFVVRQAWAQPDPIALGALYPLSGMLALLGDESFRGLELAVEERNAAGGVLGRQIRLAKGDAVDQGQAAAEVRRLVDVEHVAAMFGTCTCPLVFAASQVTELAGIPYFELGAISDLVTERGFMYLFRACPLGSSFAAATVDAVNDSLGPLWGRDPRTLKLALLHEDGLYGATISGFQATRCKDLGLNIVESVPYSANTEDLSSVVQRLRAASVDVVLHTGYQNDVVLFFRQMKLVGWKPRMIVGAGGGYSLQDTATAVGADYENTVNVDFTQYAVNEAAAPGAHDVETAYAKKYGSKPRSGHSLANYMGAKLFLEAMQRAGSLDKDKLRAAVLATDIAPGTTATGWGAKFDDKGQNSRARPMLLQWQGGSQVTISPEAAAVAQLRPLLGA